MSDKILYKDRTVTLTDKEVIIHNYYFFGVSKTIPIKDILQVKLFTLTVWLKYRLAGGSYKYLWHYFPFDIKRKNKEKFIALYLDDLWKPCITPERPDELYQLFAERVPTSTNNSQKKDQLFNGGNIEQMQNLKNQ